MEWLVVDDVPEPIVVSGVEAYPRTSALEKETHEDTEEPKVDSEEAEMDQPEATKWPSIRVQKNHPSDLIIGDPDLGIRTRKNNEEVSNSCFVSMFEPKNVKEALTDEFWIEAMQEELNQFKRSEVWDLVPRPKDLNVIGTKWIYKNKSDENGTVTRNKASLLSYWLNMWREGTWKSW